MDETKPWYTSNGVWASLLTILGGVGTAIGGWDGGDVNMVVTEAPAYLVGIAVGALGLWSLYGRWGASKKVTA